jgi:hypothetical protein
LLLIALQVAVGPPLIRAQNKETAATGPVSAQAQDIQTLKDKAPDQAHAMVSVAYHFNNLWFAGSRANWPLAEFYLNETRSHMRWAVRIIPVRKDNAGREIKLGDILESVENSPLKQMQEAIQAKDREKFVAAYEFTLVGCNACHKASDKPFLRVKVPDFPAEPMIDFNPAPDPSTDEPVEVPGLNVNSAQNKGEVVE